MITKGLEDRTVSHPVFQSLVIVSEKLNPESLKGNRFPEWSARSLGFEHP